MVSKATTNIVANFVGVFIVVMIGESRVRLTNMRSSTSRAVELNWRNRAEK
jgi:hypothetical protein